MTAVRLGTPSSLRLGATAIAGIAALLVIALGVQLGVSVPRLGLGRAAATGPAAPAAAVVDFGAAGAPPLQIAQLLGAVSRQVSAPTPSTLTAAVPAAFTPDAPPPTTPNKPKDNEPEPLVKLPTLPVPLPLPLPQVPLAGPDPIGPLPNPVGSLGL